MFQQPPIESLYSLYKRSTGVSTDTRSLKPGMIFFALKGDNFNGNKYGEKALENGAIYAVLDEMQPKFDKIDRVIFVDNVLKCLQELASYHRRQLAAKIIGLTGSNGKTTTKELLYAILKTFESETYATSGNLNNHIGVPITLLGIPPTSKFAIIEMGSNQPGDISELCEIAQPDIGLITNIGKTHLEKLVNQQGVFEEKSALYSFIKKRNGIFFVNTGDPYLKSLQSDKTLPYSKADTLSYHIQKTKNSSHLELSLTKSNQLIQIQTNLFGSYNLENVSAAISIGEYFSVPPAAMKQAIEAYFPSNMRSEIRQTLKNKLIIDGYNSNPDSLISALREFARSRDDNKIAFIGDMQELGQASEVEHRKIVDFVSLHDSFDAYFIGKEFKMVRDNDQLYYNDVKECIAKLHLDQIQGATIFLKGSRGISLEKLIKHL